MSRPVLRTILSLAAAVALTASCGTSSPGVAQQEAAPTQQRTTPPANQITKVLVFVVENHSMSQMRTGMPWVYDQALTYGYTTDYHAIRHPSLPNYLSIAGGSTFGVADDRPPASHPLSGPSVFGRALASGHTAKLYAESMPAACYRANSGEYAVRHNPWTYFTAERSACLRRDVSLSSLAGDVTNGRLPNVGVVIPNVCNDAHDCSLATANRWLRAKVGAVKAGPDFTSGRLAIVITADEDDHNEGNKVLTVVLQKSLHGRVVGTALNHYGLSRSLSQVTHTTPLRHAASATSVLSAFGLRYG
ncbi:MAG TPA: alkaline phosphatase family protein [Nocardioides sp.]|nr:alkaline phosphatase family protein [Nocardioides sp.]